MNLSTADLRNYRTEVNIEENSKETQEKNRLRSNLSEVINIVYDNNIISFLSILTMINKYYTKN
jgi:hypothetical protein